MWFRRNQWKVLLAAFIAVQLAVAFYIGGNSPGSRGWTTIDETPEAVSFGLKTEEAALADATGEEPSPSAAAQADTPEPEELPDTLEPAKESETPSPAAASPSAAAAEAKQTAAPEQTETADAAVQAPVQTPEPAPEPEPDEPDQTAQPDAESDQHPSEPPPEPQIAEPQETEAAGQTGTVTMSISCAAVLDNLEWLDPAKTDLIPEDGWILEPVTVSFQTGESVFELLLRVTREYGVHMEYMDTPLYNSAYIEGIFNLYEFDCGSGSGWMYSVNGWFPNYGCSRYALEDGDQVCWQYTCDLGNDIGGSNWTE